MTRRSKSRRKRMMETFRFFGVVMVGVFGWFFASVSAAYVPSITLLDRTYESKILLLEDQMLDNYPIRYKRQAGSEAEDNLNSTPMVQDLTLGDVVAIFRFFLAAPTSQSCSHRLACEAVRIANVLLPD
ncbi:uncharacterized protein LOC136037764 [Artemia franciscana]|uniref:uncharacterized protein LOC136037764 n=1 Tax=Artemia franciscana TaxID=6661 RepID=UPI0032DA28F3